MSRSKVVPLRQSNMNSQTVAYGRHGCVQVFVGQERNWESLREGFERIMSYRPNRNWMLIKIESPDYVCEYVDCGPVVKQQACDAGLFSEDRNQLNLI